jgi:hypothetical protein
MNLSKQKTTQDGEKHLVVFDRKLTKVSVELYSSRWWCCSEAKGPNGFNAIKIDPLAPSFSGYNLSGYISLGLHKS